MPHLVLVDDDRDILDLLSKFFVNHSFEVSVAVDGSAAYQLIADRAVDLVILDVMLKGEDGFSICRRLRSESRVPIIMLTAMSDHTDRVVGLEIGADDYLSKPFDARELLARVKAVLRRSATMSPAPSGTSTRPMLAFAGWRLNVAKRELRATDHSLVILSGAEFDLLLAFAEHSQRVLNRDQLLDLARGSTHAAFDRSVDVLVSRLRRKLEADPKAPSVIRTVRNGGYIFMPQVTQV